MNKKTKKLLRQEAVDKEVKKRKERLMAEVNQSNSFTSKIDKSVEALFQYTRSKVTDQDIIEFSPDDPGYANYVKLWRTILKTGTIPRYSEFDLSEVIGLMGWGNPSAEQAAERFRNFRRFTSAVGVALIHYGNDSESVRPANYLARDLIVDLNYSDQQHISLLRKVFPATRARLITLCEELEYPFFTFGELILAQVAGDYKGSEILATQLIADEAAVRADEAINFLVVDQHFLLGLTGYDQLHMDWIKFAHELVNENAHQDLQFVIDVLKQINK